MPAAVRACKDKYAYKIHQNMITFLSLGR